MQEKEQQVNNQQNSAMTSIGSDLGWSTFKTNHLVLYIVLLTLCCGGLFVSNVIQGVFIKRMADDMPSGPYFILVLCSASFVVVFGVCLVIRDFYEAYLEDSVNRFMKNMYGKLMMMRRSRRDINHQISSNDEEGRSLVFHANNRLPNNQETSLNTVKEDDLDEEQVVVVQEKTKRGKLSHGSLFVIGALDSMNGLLILFATHSTPAALQPILSQSAVPMTFLMAYVLIHLPIMLKKRQFSVHKSYWKHTLKFFSLELLASLIVLVGIIITLIPTFIKIATDSKSLDGSVLWSMIFLVGVIPGALMSVVQELYSKKHQKLDYLHLLLWVSIYQILVDASSFWVNMVVPGVGIHSLSDLGGMFDRGFGCLLGLNHSSNNTIGNNTIISNQTFFSTSFLQSTNTSNSTHPLNPAVVDGCGMASVDTLVFIMGYVGTYAFTAILLKMTSSITLILINSFVAPATDILFFILGMDEFSWYTGGAIVVITFGVLLQIGSDYFKEKSGKKLDTDKNGEKKIERDEIIL